MSSHFCVLLCIFLFSYVKTNIILLYFYIYVNTLFMACVVLSNIPHTFLEMSIIEMPAIATLNFNHLHILYIFHLDLANLMPSLENYCILFPNILISSGYFPVIYSFCSLSSYLYIPSLCST